MGRIGVTSAARRWLAVPWSEAMLAVTIVAAAAAPVFLVASADIWRAAAQDDVAQRAVELASPDRNGLDITYEVSFDAEGLERASDELDSALGAIPELAPTDRTLYTLPGLVTVGPLRCGRLARRAGSWRAKVHWMRSRSSMNSTTRPVACG